MSDLAALVARELQRPVTADIATLATQLRQQLGGAAVLFYGSALRTANLDGVLDFYVLRDEAERTGPPWAFLWPHVSYHECEIGGRIIRAKVATMGIGTFAAAATGHSLDTTIWTRFAQPARLLVPVSTRVAQAIADAVCACVRTAARFAGALGPDSGSADDYWLALFAHTYRAELRIESHDRGRSVLSGDPAYYRDALRLAWRDIGLIGDADTARLHPTMDAAPRRLWQRAWRRRAIAAKPLNALRLLRAARTFDGAARYALWKIERHSGIAIALTPWRERHPILAAPGILFHLWRVGGR
ncbi:MAG TPA: hypothetical protein VNS79_02385 [Sphingobium sp.]|nr:hypothetical protein [Sphingobium sp.]